MYVLPYMFRAHGDICIVLLVGGKHLNAYKVLKRVTTSLLAFKMRLPFPVPWQSLVRCGLQHSILCVGNGTDCLPFVYCGAIAAIFLY